MIDIYIPSYNRPDAPVIKRFAEAGIPFTIVLDHEGDVADYRKHLSKTTKIMLLDKALGIGYVRQKIKERYNGTPIMMLDDDTIFSVRKFDTPDRLDVCKTASSLRRWVSVVDRFCAENKFDLGSVSDSAFNYQDVRKVKRTCSLCSVTIFNSDRCREIDYDPHLYKRMEDHDYICQAITKRFTFLSCNEVLRHCPMNKGAKDKGGCSEVYRNDAAMWATYNYFHEKWGDILVMRNDKKIGSAPDFKVDYKKLRKKYGYDY